MDFIINTANQDDTNFVNLILDCVFDSAGLDINEFNSGAEFRISTVGIYSGCDFFIDLSYYRDIETYNAFQIYFIQYLSKAIFGDQLDPRPILEDLKNRVLSGDIISFKPAPTPKPTSTPQVTTVLVPEVTTTLVEESTVIYVPEVTSIIDTPQTTPEPTSSRLF